MDEIEMLERIIEKDLSKICHTGDFVDGFVTTSVVAHTINKVKEKMEVNTVTPNGGILSWSYEINYPHKVKNNVSSLK